MFKFGIFVSSTMLFVVSLLCLSYVSAGTSKCPNRTEIYPCICMDRSIGKSRYHITVICQRLPHGDSLTAIEDGLLSVDIDKFLLYDAYWSNDSRRLLSAANIPVNYASSLKITEVEIVDSKMSSFGCPEEYNCRTNYLKRFTAINTTVDDDAHCNNQGPSIKAWIGCPGKVEEFQIDGGYTSEMSLKSDFFPETMSKMKVLRMPNNHISRIDKRTLSFLKFPVLNTLDLSHNLLRDGRNLFSSPMKIKYLDLSHNFIRTLVDFQNLPDLQILKLGDNQIVSLLENEWNIPGNLKHIDLINNHIECNCGIRWVNSTLPIHTAFLGNCATPDEVASKKLREASRFLNERCTEDGKIGAKKPKNG